MFEVFQKESKFTICVAYPYIGMVKVVKGVDEFPIELSLHVVVTKWQLLLLDWSHELLSELVLKHVG